MYEAARLREWHHVGIMKALVDWVWNGLGSHGYVTVSTKVEEMGGEFMVKSWSVKSRSVR
jgi:hypothetical protein